MGQNNSSSSRNRRQQTASGNGYTQQQQSVAQPGVSYGHSNQGYPQNIPRPFQQMGPPNNAQHGLQQQATPQGNRQTSSQPTAQLGENQPNTAQVHVPHEDYMWQSNFSTTLDDTRKNLGGVINNDISIVDKKIGSEARTIAEHILVGLLKHQNGRYGSFGLSSQGSFQEGISLKSHKEFNYMITLEDVGSSITEVKNGAKPGFVDIGIRPTGKAINNIEELIGILSPPGEGQFWVDIKTVVSSVTFPTGWSLRIDDMVKSNFFFHGPSVSIFFDVTVASSPTPVQAIIDIAVGVPIPKSHYPNQIDILQRMPVDHPLHGIMCDCFESSELTAVVKNGQMRLSFSQFEVFLIGNMPSMYKSGYLMFRAFRDSHISPVYRMGVLPQYSTTSLMLKTIFLHELFTFPEIGDWTYAKGVEPHPPHTRDFMADRLMGIILRWSKAAKTGNLSNFFISTANVMKPGGDYEDDDDFLDMAALGSFRQSVPDLLDYVARLQERINALQASDRYKLPLPGNPYAGSTTAVGWMFKEENFVNGRRFRYPTKEIVVSA